MSDCIFRENAIGVRLGVKRGGCNGFTYALSYADSVGRADEVVQADGIKVYIEPKAVFYILGTSVLFDISPVLNVSSFSAKWILLKLMFERNSCSGILTLKRSVVVENRSRRSRTHCLHQPLRNRNQCLVMIEDRCKIKL